MVAFAIIFGLIPLPAIIRFVLYCSGRRNGTPTYGKMLEVWNVMVLPLVFLLMDALSKNDCCGDSAAFSPQHRPVYIF